MSRNIWHDDPLGLWRQKVIDHEARWLIGNSFSILKLVNDCFQTVRLLLFVQNVITNRRRRTSCRSLLRCYLCLQDLLVATQLWNPVSQVISTTWHINRQQEWQNPLITTRWRARLHVFISLVSLIDCYYSLNMIWHAQWLVDQSNSLSEFYWTERNMQRRQLCK